MSILKGIWDWLDERTGIAAIAQHPVPQEKGWRAWMYVLGVATLTSFLVAVVTGIPIAMTFIPSTGHAYASIMWLDHTAVLGKQLRALHYFSGIAMMVLVGAHMIRVFLTGSFKYPRELNWLSGVILLFITVGFTFTGQILRWDNFGLWTLQIMAAVSSRTPVIGQWLAHFVLGGSTFNGTTLSRVFALHVFILPAIIAAVLGLHLYLVLKVGISESPRAGRPVNPKEYRAWYENLLRRDGVPYVPDGAWREVVFGTFCVCFIVAMALYFGPIPLGAPPDPTNLVVQPRPDWYFIWFYGALALVPYGMENYVMIGGPLLFIIILLAIPFLANKGERSPVRRPWAVISVCMAVVLVGSMTVAGTLAPWSPRYDTPPLPTKVIGTSSGPIARGAALWHSQGCAYCHSVSGYGGIRGPSLTNIGNELTSDQMIIRILNGGDNMPQYAGILKPAQINDLVAFLQSRKQWATPGLQPSSQIPLVGHSAAAAAWARAHAGAKRTGRAATHARRMTAKAKE